MKKALPRLLALFLVVLFVFAGCVQSQDNSSQSSGSGATSSTASNSGGSGGGVSTKDSMVLAMSTTWETLMPYNTTSNYGDVIFGQIYDKIVYHDGEYNVVPRLAESWEMSADNTQMTFHIDKNAKWHDGTPVTAHDGVFTFELVTNPEVQATKRANFVLLQGTDSSGAAIAGETLGVKATDDHTLVLSFKSAADPDAILWQFCRYFYMLPRHVLEGMTPAEINNGDFWAQNPIGSGPYKYSNQIAGERITLTANEDYHLGAPKVNTLIIRVVPSTNLLAGLMAGEIDMVVGGLLGTIPLEDWEMAQQQDNLETASVPTFGYQYMTLNMQKSYLTEEVRHAICMAIDRQKIVDGLLLGEGAVLTSGSLPPTHPYYQGEVKQEFNPEKAEQMLKDAGWDFNREIELLAPTGNVVRERSAVLIQQDLQAIGMKVKITTADFATVMATMQDANGCDLGLMGASGSIDPDEGTNQSNPSGKSNFANFPADDTRLFDLYMQGKAGTSFAERKPIYDRIQAMNVEIGCRLYLYSANALMAYNKNLTGADIKSFANVNWNTWEWEFTA